MLKYKHNFIFKNIIPNFYLIITLPILEIFPLYINAANTVFPFDDTEITSGPGAMPSQPPSRFMGTVARPGFALKAGTKGLGNSSLRNRFFCPPEDLKNILKSRLGPSYPSSLSGEDGDNSDDDQDETMTTSVSSVTEGTPRELAEVRYHHIHPDSSTTVHQTTADRCTAAIPVTPAQMGLQALLSPLSGVSFRESRFPSALSTSTAHSDLRSPGLFSPPRMGPDHTFTSLSHYLGTGTPMLEEETLFSGRTSVTTASPPTLEMLDPYDDRPPLRAVVVQEDIVTPPTAAPLMPAMDTVDGVTLTRDPLPPTIVTSFDGGGIRGLGQAICCKHIEDAYHIWLPRVSTMVLGTSIGALNGAAAISPNPENPMEYLFQRPDQIVELFNIQNTTALFHKTWKRSIATFGGLTGSRYNRSHLDTFLSRNFGTLPLSAVSIPREPGGISHRFIALGCLQRPGIEGLQLYPFDSSIPSPYSLVDALRVSSAAPTYFDYVKVDDAIGLDGGLIVNNPTLEGLLRVQAWSPEVQKKTFIFSLGTGHLPVLTPSHSSIQDWAGPISDIAISLQTEQIHQVVRQLLPQPVAGANGSNYTRYQRIQPELTSALKMDDTNPDHIENYARVVTNYIENKLEKDEYFQSTLRQLSDHFGIRHSFHEHHSVGAGSTAGTEAGTGL